MTPEGKRSRDVGHGRHKLTRGELAKKVEREERDVVVQSRKRALVQKIMADREKWLANAGLISLILFIIVLVTMILSVALILIQVSKRYAQMISLINNKGPRSSGGVAVYPSVVPLASPGFNLALACQYPAFTGLLGYVNGGLPYACYICVYSKTIRPAFMKNPTAYLASMYNYSRIGKNDVAAGNTTGSLAIVCESWGKACGLDKCENPCPPDSNPQWYDYLAASGTYASQGAMIGAAVGGPWGLAIGAVIGGVAGGLSTAFSAKTKQKKENCVPA